MGVAVILLFILWLLLACACGWFGFHLARQNGRLLLRIDALEQNKGTGGAGSFGLPAGSVLSDFSLPLLTGGTMTLSQWRGRMVVLIFLSPTCRFCKELLPGLSTVLPQDLTTADLVPLIVSSGTIEENRRFFDGHRISCPVLVEEKPEVGPRYKVTGTPLAFIVDERGTTVGKALVGGEPIVGIFRAAAGKGAEPGSARAKRAALAGSKLQRDGLKAGTTAPEFRLPAVAGGEVALSDYRGRQVLLVFSDPDCKPCSALSPELEKVHRQSPDLQVLMISRGDPEANRQKVREYGLTFPVVLQRQWEISREYGMFATPIGYLVDENGVIAEDVAVGSDKILGLASQRQGSLQQL